MNQIRVIVNTDDAGAELTGVAPMFFITFKKDEAGIYKDKRHDFYTQLIRRGIFMTPHHHAYICYRHTEEDLEIAAQAIAESMGYVKEKYRK